MKALGIVRKPDQLGRIVLPVGLRRKLNINAGDPLEILVDRETIILRRYSSVCTFCGDTSITTNYKGKVVCAVCSNKIKSLLETLK